jgi:hypothetical protein
MKGEHWTVVICKDCRVLVGATNDWSICPKTGFRHIRTTIKVKAA